jgi:hypothetical protein
MLAAGPLAVVASFLPFYTNGSSVNVWRTGLFPIAFVIVVVVLATAVLVSLAGLTHLNVANGVLGYRLPQLLLALSSFAALLALAFFFAERGGSGLGLGYFLLLISAIGSCAGATLFVNEGRSRRTQWPATPARPAASSAIAIGDIVVLVAGALAVIGSFLPFYKTEFFSPVVGVQSNSYNSWDTDFQLLFPVATLIAVFTILAALLVALDKFADIEFAVLGIDSRRLPLALGFFATVLALAYLIQDKDPIDLGTGFWLLLAASVASTAGSALVRNEQTTGAV